MRVGLASLLLIVSGARSVHNATADGDTRTLSFHHTHSGEDLTVTFKRYGRYDEAALKKLNTFLRDWRNQDQTTMDRQLFDIIWEVYRDVDAKQPIQIISAYRSPATNAMLRRRSAHSGVARYSQHMLGHAMDFFIPGVPLEQIRFAGLRLQRGGVGFYPTSGSPFVHLDTGGIRHWPRMTHDQLARVFPDGRTVHIPSDGKPLKGYDLALADIQRRGNGEDVAAPSKARSFLASLFGRKPADDEDDGGNDSTGTDARAMTVAATEDDKPGLVTRLTGIIPLPRAKPAAAYRIASAASTDGNDRKSIPALRPVDGDEYAPQSPLDIINARGLWDNAPATKPDIEAQVAALKAHGSAAADDPQATASLPPNVAQALAYAPPAKPRAQNPRFASLAPPVIKPEHGIAATLLRTKMAEKANDIWTRAVIVARSARTSLSVSLLGDQDMTVMREHFVKPANSVTMAFSDDPQMGLVCEKFSGSTTAPLPVTAFNVQTASLR